MGFNLSGIKNGIDKAKQAAVSVPVVAVAAIKTAVAPVPQRTLSAVELTEERAKTAGIDLEITTTEQDQRVWKYQGGHLRELRIAAFLKAEGARIARSGREVRLEDVKNGGTLVRIGTRVVLLERTAP